MRLKRKREREEKDQPARVRRMKTEEASVTVPAPPATAPTPDLELHSPEWASVEAFLGDLPSDLEGPQTASSASVLERAAEPAVLLVVPLEDASDQVLKEQDR